MFSGTQRSELYCPLNPQRSESALTVAVDQVAPRVDDVDGDKKRREEGGEGDDRPADGFDPTLGGDEWRPEYTDGFDPTFGGDERGPEYSNPMHDESDAAEVVEDAGAVGDHGAHQKAPLEGQGVGQGAGAEEDPEDGVGHVGHGRDDDAKEKERQELAVLGDLGHGHLGQRAPEEEERGHAGHQWQTVRDYAPGTAAVAFKDRRVLYEAWSHGRDASRLRRGLITRSAETKLGELKKVSKLWDRRRSLFPTCHPDDVTQPMDLEGKLSSSNEKQDRIGHATVEFQESSGKQDRIGHATVEFQKWCEAKIHRTSPTDSHVLLQSFAQEAVDPHVASRSGPDDAESSSQALTLVPTIPEYKNQVDLDTESMSQALTLVPTIPEYKNVCSLACPQTKST
uniref:Uncharacterized protein n=1 Tax=Steinernema glaseri TaxID=37863 RepID=A0A1I7ZPC0_9BILA